MTVKSISTLHSANSGIMDSRIFKKIINPFFDIDEDNVFIRSTLLEEDKNLNFAKITIATIVIAVFMFFLWSGFTKVNEMAVAEGEVIPDGKVQVVQHLEGGIVKDIKVHEGDYVTQGQTLLILDGDGAMEDLMEIHAKLTTLNLQGERLISIINNKPLNMDDMEGGARQKSEQKRVYDGMIQARKAEQEVMKAQIAQRQETLARLKFELDTITKNTALANEGLGMMQKLSSQGLINKTTYLKKQEEVNNMKGRQLTLEREISSARNEIIEYDSRLIALDATYRDNAEQELEKIKSEITQNTENFKKLQHRVERLNITAPTNGFVKGLSVNTIGSVIGSGQKVLEIVPDNKELMVEIRILPSDIGQVKPGREVRLRFDSFDYTRFGEIKDELESISATSFNDENLKSYYRGKVKLQKDYLGATADKNKIVPGMTVDARIITGEKSILNYLLKPIHAASSSALTEK